MFIINGEEARMRDSVRSEFGVTLTDEQINWYRWKKAGSANKELMPQEHPSTAREAFLSSGRHIFNLEKLEILRKGASEPIHIGELRDDKSQIELVENLEGPLTIWKMFRDGRKYFIPADVAEGVQDGCYSVAPVFDRSSWEVVAEIRLRCDPGEFGRMLCTLGEFYNFALLAPEMNNHGHATLEAIKAQNYPHILKTSDLWPDETPKLGFPTDANTKEKIISALRNSIDDIAYVEHSKIAIQEMRGAVRDANGRMVSERARAKIGGDNNPRLYLDCVITRCIGLYCLKFLTLDETYRESPRDASPMTVSHISGRKSYDSGGYRRSTGY